MTTNRFPVTEGAISVGVRGSTVLLAALLGGACQDPVFCGRSGTWLTCEVPTPRELLGQKIFEDTGLSEPPGQACASCHVESLAFTGTAGSSIAAVAAGSRPNVFGDRNPPTVKYTQFSPPFAIALENDNSGNPQLAPAGGMFWDGRAVDLVEQAKGPLLNPREMNNRDPGAVVNKLRKAGYASLFKTVYGQDALDDVDEAYNRMADAIAAFEKSVRFHPFSSKFDDYLRGLQQLTPVEGRGLELFSDPEKGNCIACHVGDPESRVPEDWLFTDFTYDTLGVPRNRQIADNDDPTHFDLGLCKQPGIEQHLPRGFTAQSLCGAFKVPTLRNVALTAPYMHNGYFSSLRDVVRFYVTRDTDPQLWYPLDESGAPQVFDDLPVEYHANVNTTEVPYDRKLTQAPRLTDDEIDAVVAFLQTLTDR